MVSTVLSEPRLQVANNGRYIVRIVRVQARMAMTADHYTYRVTWSAENGEYVGLCAEFPSLSWLGQTQEAAFGGIRALVAEVVEDMLGSHETPPEPMADRMAGQPDR